MKPVVLDEKLKNLLPKSKLRSLCQRATSLPLTKHNCRACIKFNKTLFTIIMIEHKYLLI